MNDELRPPTPPAAEPFAPPDNEPAIRSQPVAAQAVAAQRVAAAARQRLHDQARLAIQRIWCECEAGRLFLRGQVPSFYYKQLAQEAVAGLEGVGQVVNEIEVVW